MLFTLQRTYYYAISKPSETIIQDTLNKLEKRLRRENVDIDRDEDSISFAGNTMAFFKGPLTTLNGEIIASIEDHTLVLKYELSFGGQSVFVIVALIILLISVNVGNDFGMAATGFYMIVFVWGCIWGVNVLDAIVHEIGISAA